MIFVLCQSLTNQNTPEFASCYHWRMCDSVADIPLRREYPKIGRTDDAEVVGNRVAEDGPVFRHLLAQETQNGIAEVVVGRLAPICASRFYASTPIGARLDQGAGSSWECNGLQSGILALPATAPPNLPPAAPVGPVPLPPFGAIGKDRPECLSLVHVQGV